MADLLSYKQVLDILESIAERHYLINSFYIGEPHDMNTEDLVYPVLQVYPEIARFPQIEGEYKTVELRMKIKVLDKDLQDNSTQADVHNDTFRICQDIINEINQHPFYLHSNATIAGDIELGQLNEFLDDYLCGWEFDLNLRFLNTNSFCGLPIEGIPGYSVAGPVDSDYSISWGYVTCDNITGCTNITNYIQNLINSSPGAGSTFTKNGINTFTGGTATLVSVNVTGGTFGTSTFSGLTTFASASATTFSASTLFSGSTNLNTIISGAATRVQPGLNTYTGGTALLPTVNISAATLVSLSSTTVSGGTFYSGSTPLYNILIQQITGSSTNVNVKNGTNTYTGGSPTLLSVNISAATLDTLTVTGNTILSATSATTVVILNSGMTIVALNDYSGNIINTGVTSSTIIGGSGNTIPANAINVQILGGVNISSTQNNTTYSRNLVVTGTSNGNLYATNIFSGSTNIASMFGGGSGSQNLSVVSGGTNTYTGGTYLQQTVNVSALTINTLTASGASTFTNTLSAATLSAGTIISGSTNLQSIFNTINAQLLTEANLSGATFTGNVVVPTISASTFSGGTYLSGGTNLLNIFLLKEFSGGSGVNTVVSGGTNTYTGGTFLQQTVNVSALTINTLFASGASTFTSTLSAATLSAATILSASTNLYNIFQKLGQNSVVANGTNTTTGGTFFNQTVNVVASPSFNAVTASGASTFTNTLSASTLSAATMISGSTNLYNIFAKRALPWEFGLALSDETTQITTGTSKVTCNIPFSGTITGVTISLSQTGSTTTTVNIKNSGTTIFSTTPTIDANEFDSSSAAVAAVISVPTMPRFARLTFDIDTAGTGAAGLKCWITGFKN